MSSVFEVIEIYPHKSMCPPRRSDYAAFSIHHHRIGYTARRRLVFAGIEPDHENVRYWKDALCNNASFEFRNLTPEEQFFLDSIEDVRKRRKRVLG